MPVLVAVATRHGATQEIAEAIGKTIHEAGFAVDVMKLADSSEYGPRPDPAQYDAVVLGSGVYLGQWLAPAREFVKANRETLEAMPVWAFSSGPIGADHVDDGQRPAVATLVADLKAVDYRIFGGKLDRGHLGLAERILVTVIRAGEEDDRDWDDVASWADGIAQALRATTTQQA
jgi:menaquinone-dependent protoporphyrinogen oxidase